jgi:hypothetical protein
MEPLEGEGERKEGLFFCLCAPCVVLMQTARALVLGAALQPARARMRNNRRRQCARIAGACRAVTAAYNKGTHKTHALRQHTWRFATSDCCCDWDLPAPWRRAFIACFIAESLAELPERLERPWRGGKR